MSNSHRLTAHAAMLRSDSHRSRNDGICRAGNACGVILVRILNRQVQGKLVILKSGYARQLGSQHVQSGVSEESHLCRAPLHRSGTARARHRPSTQASCCSACLELPTPASQGQGKPRHPECRSAASLVPEEGKCWRLEKRATFCRSEVVRHTSSSKVVDPKTRSVNPCSQLRVHCWPGLTGCLGRP